MNKLDLAFLISFQLRLVRIEIFLHIFVANRDVLIQIGRSKPNYADIEFVVAALKIFIQLALGKRNAGSQKFLDFAQTNLIAHELFDVLFSQTERRQPVLHKIIELINVEARIAMESRQLSHDISNLRSAWA